MNKEPSVFSKEKICITYHRHFLASTFSESLSPFHLSWVSLSVEIPVAFRPAKLEGLKKQRITLEWISETAQLTGAHLAVIADKCSSMTRIDRTAAEIAHTDSHSSL